MTNLQDKPIVVGTPVEIEYACNEIRKILATLSWISHPYFIAQRFFRQDATTKQRFIYPETYAPNPSNADAYGYHRLTPDNDYSGMFFFMVGKGIIDYKENQRNFMRYPVSIIFSANLKLIDEAQLEQGLFTQDLMRQVRRLLTTSSMLFEFDYNIKTETRDLREVYQEFLLADMEQYNRAPMQCFRFDLDMIVRENCGTDPIANLPTGGFDNVSTDVITVINTGPALPVTVQPNTTFLILNVSGLTSDLDVSNYMPSGLLKGATVRMRKMDSTESKITYDKDGLTYGFVDRPTEFIDFLWNGTELII